jgi:hypothetical protein
MFNCCEISLRETWFLVSGLELPRSSCCGRVKTSSRSLLLSPVLLNRTVDSEYPFFVICDYTGKEVVG